MTGVGLLVLVGAVFGATAAALWLAGVLAAGRDAADRALFRYDGADAPKGHELTAGE